jgi:hypothetical protein
MEVLPQRLRASCTAGRIGLAGPRPTLPSRQGRRPGSAHRRTLNVCLVLKQEPAHQADDPEAAKLERARKAIFEALLGPSLCDSASDAPPRHLEAAPPEAGCCYHFCYGASMAFSTLSRNGVRPLSRDAAMVVDPAVRMRFRHRGGAWPAPRGTGGQRPSGATPRVAAAAAARALRWHAAGHSRAPAPGGCPHCAPASPIGALPRHIGPCTGVPAPGSGRKVPWPWPRTRLAPRAGPIPAKAAGGPRPALSPSRRPPLPPGCPRFAGYATLEHMSVVANGSSSSSSSSSSNDHGAPTSNSSNGSFNGSRSSGGAGTGSGGSSPSGARSASSSPGGTRAGGGARPRYPPFDPHVHGVLYKLRVEDLERLAKKESGYVLQEFEARGGRTPGGGGRGRGGVRAAPRGSKLRRGPPPHQNPPPPQPRRHRIRGFTPQRRPHLHVPLLPWRQ